MWMGGDTRAHSSRNVILLPLVLERDGFAVVCFASGWWGKKPKLNLLSHINTKLAKWTGGPGLTPANLFHFLGHSSPFTHWLIKTKISQALSSLRTLEWLSSVFMLWAIHSWLFNVTSPWSLRPHHQSPLLRDTDHLTSSVTPPQYLVIYPSHNLLHFLHNSYN